MSVFVSLHLFGKPGMELTEGEAVTSQQLRDLGDDLHDRLQEAAEIVEKLTNAGWEAQMMLYDICLSNPYITTKAQAEEKMQDLGIDPEKLFIDEWEDEDEEDFDEEEGEFADEDEDEEEKPL
jgi:hypothetical protein